MCTEWHPLVVVSIWTNQVEARNKQFILCDTIVFLSDKQYQVHSQYIRFEENQLRVYTFGIEKEES